MGKSFFSFLIIALTSTFCLAGGGQKSAVDYVDPFIGTDFFAHTYPGAVVPFSMVQLSPDTYNQGWTYCSGYQSKDFSLMGFSHTHLSGTGGAEMGDILIMPTTGQKLFVVPGTRENPDEGYRSRFSHDREWATPGYYAVDLLDYGIKAELTATKRVGVHRYTFPKSENAHIIMDLTHVIGGAPEAPSHVEFVNNYKMQGWKQGSTVKVYFVAEFSKPFAAFGTWDTSYDMPESDEDLYPYHTHETGNAIGAFVNYVTTEGEQVVVKVAISYVSVEGAQKNLDAEVPHWDFEQVRYEARETWAKALSAIDIQGGTEDQKQIFYTGLYHSLLPQYISSDVDGKYVGMDGSIQTAKDFEFFPTFLAWDTFRSEHPLITLVAPEYVDDIVKSIESKVRTYGWLPAQHTRNQFQQGMVGDHLVPIVVDAYMKGFRDFDVEFLYNAMKAKATTEAPSKYPSDHSRSGIDYTNKLGYAPCDRITESVSNTLEFAYNDWCLAQMAKEMGKMDDYEMFMKKAGNYKNVWDSETRFMRPRKVNGDFLELKTDKQEIKHYKDHSYFGYFDPFLIGRRPNRHYSESDAWDYLWFVPHDPKGLVNLFGSQDAFIAKLDSHFTISPEVSFPKYVGVVGTYGQYVHGNQPAHHVAYMYDYAGQPWKTQMRTRHIMDFLYRTGRAGICGNDDMGSLSSWYVLSAMGFYPVSPGSNEYAIGSPLFDKATINLGAPYSGKEFTVKAVNVSAENKYIQSAKLNGRDLNKAILSQEAIANGGTLELIMGPDPNKSWGLGK